MKSIPDSRYSMLVKKIFLCVLSAVLLALSFSRFDVSFLAWFGLVPLFFAINGQTKLRASFLFYFTGVIFWLGVIYWLVHVTFAGMILMALYLALYFGIFGLILSSIKNRESIVNLLFIPSIWVILEYIRSHLFTGFGWALMGYSQYRSILPIQIADITGAYGVSFVIILVNICIYKILKRKLPVLHSITCLLIVSSVFAYGFYKISGEESDEVVKISVIQGNIPQEMKWDRRYEASILDRYFILTKEAAKTDPNLIIWPEASFPEVLRGESPNFSALLNLAGDLEIPLLAGVVILEDGKYSNSALLISKEKKSTKRYDKLHLVPFGEYVPLKKILGFLETVVPIGNFTAGKEYTVFKVPGEPARFSVLVCFEDVFPELSRGFAKRGANFLVNITNDAWFKDTTAPYQHLAASVFRAVENRRPVVRCANTGISGFIDANGGVDLLSEESRSTFVEGIKTKGIPREQYLTFYTCFGDIFVLICICIVSIGVITQRKYKLT